MQDDLFTGTPPAPLVRTLRYAHFVHFLCASHTEGTQEVSRSDRGKGFD
jgi:hypothetical protein